MNGLLNSWWGRTAILAGLTWLGYKYLPFGGNTGKTVVLAVGSVATVGALASGVPLVRNLIAGQLPAVTPPAQPTT